VRALAHLASLVVGVAGILVGAVLPNAPLMASGAFCVLLWLAFDLHNLAVRGRAASDQLARARDPRLPL
jgi:hypothetical protein